ncbi:MAG: hypothetical protein HC780_11515 [Leptolyngbyaceae cyanobacterium CSU_1_3]|nr:hypothetical protein [Leptolyngbyaceae cyanobacterium CSU_1_3]
MNGSWYFPRKGAHSRYRGCFEAVEAAIAAIPKQQKLGKGKSFITLQNGGLVFDPVHIFNQTEFIDQLIAIDYKLIDLWQDLSKPCAVHFHPEFHPLSFKGLYFKR